MHAAGLQSPRLQRVLTLLRQGGPFSTKQIVRRAKVMAVSACISELRQHGAEIVCIRQYQNDVLIFTYTMTKAPDAPCKS